MANTRLTPDTWLDAGFDALQEQGAHAIAAEPLARKLGTTKGSFYWHFRDVPTFQDAMLAKWQELALASVNALLAHQSQADQKLRIFGRLVLEDQNEMPLRVWARRDPRAARVLNEVDTARHAALMTFLGEIGLSNKDFADVLQASLIGLPQLATKDSTGPFDTMVDTILALT